MQGCLAMACESTAVAHLCRPHKQDKLSVCRVNLRRRRGLRAARGVKPQPDFRSGDSTELAGHCKLRGKDHVASHWRGLHAACAAGPHPAFALRLSRHHLPCIPKSMIREPA